MWCLLLALPTPERSNTDLYITASIMQRDGRLEFRSSRSRHAIAVPADIPCSLYQHCPAPPGKQLTGHAATANLPCQLQQQRGCRRCQQTNMDSSILPALTTHHRAVSRPFTVSPGMPPSVCTQHRRPW